MSSDVSEDQDGKVHDPVCDMEFAVRKAAATVEYQGTRYYFCTDACRRQFEQEPDRYARKAAPESREPGDPGPSHV